MTVPLLVCRVMFKKVYSEISRYFLATDTKGDVFGDYAGMAQKYYGYTPYVIDLRNPTRSNGFNMLHLVNKYMDQFKVTGSITDKARAKRYAKITAKTIVLMEGFDGDGLERGNVTLSARLKSLRNCYREFSPKFTVPEGF
jgi:hypothetical protein